jgi:hypothetical protein
VNLKDLKLKLSHLFFKILFEITRYAIIPCKNLRLVGQFECFHVTCLAGYGTLHYLKCGKELESVGNAAAVAEGLELGAGAQQERNHFPLQRGA